jgi:hypothetical protein
METILGMIMIHSDIPTLVHVEKRETFYAGTLTLVEEVTFPSYTLVPNVTVTVGLNKSLGLGVVFAVFFSRTQSRNGILETWNLLLGCKAGFISPFKYRYIYHNS